MHKAMTVLMQTFETHHNTTFKVTVSGLTVIKLSIFSREIAIVAELEIYYERPFET